MQILITGAGTLLGNSLAKYLAKKNFSLICTYRNTFPSNLKGIKNIKLIHFDMAKKITFSKKFNILVHCASAIPDYNCSKNYYNKVNVVGFKNLLDLCVKNKCNNIILISTMSVYGKINVKKISEKYKGKKFDDYGATKKKMEEMLKKFTFKNNISSTTLRLPAILGKNSKHNFISNIFQKLKNKEQINVFNPNLKFNNIVHVSNLCEIIYKSLLNKGFLVLNVASKYPMKISNLIDMMIKYIYPKQEILLVKYLDNNKGFNINTKKILRKKYNLYSTKETLKRFVKDNLNT